MINLTQPQRRYDLSQSLLGQAVAPTRNANAIQGIGKLLQAMLAIKGMNRAETEEDRIKKAHEQKSADYNQSLMSAFTGSTNREQAMSGGNARGPSGMGDMNKDALVMSMLSGGNPQHQGAALSSILAQPKDDSTGKQKDYLFARQNGYQGTFEDFIKAGVPSTSVNNINYPTGMAPNPNFDQQRPVGPDNSPAIVIPGSKLDLDTQAAKRREEQARLEAEQAAGKAQQKDMTVVAGIDNTLSAIDEAIDAADWNSTGFLGKALSVLPGTDAYNLEQDILTIKANVGFDRLQQMRDLSPTGGALGQVAVQELAALQASIAALEPGMGDKKLVDNFKKVKKHYTRWKATLSNDLPENTANFGEITDNGLEVLDSEGNILGYFN